MSYTKSGNTISRLFYMKTILVAVCVKNEESTILPCLDSVSEAISHASGSYAFKLYICLNGSTDNSKALIETWSKNQRNFDIEIIILQEANLIEAQRAIVNSAGNRYGYYSFFDADIVLEKDALLLLIKKLEDSKDTVVTYALSIPVARKNETFVEKVMNLYNKPGGIYTKRKHLHGRAFVTKDWSIPTTNPTLLVDDIYLSFYYLTKYGLASIQQIQEAKVYFFQIRTLGDFYRVYRRRRIELHKLFTLFPKFKLLPKDQIDRKIVWKLFLKERFYNKLLWFSHHLFTLISKYRFLMEKFWLPTNREQWEQPITSKKSNTEPILILIEGLDCSGKKTTSRLLTKKLRERGISSTINIGPLGPKWYRKVSEIVSLNSFPNAIRSLVYGLEIVIGRKEVNKPSPDIVIQVSSVLRSAAYAYATKKMLRWNLFRLFSWRIPRYQLAIYLTSDYNERKKRHAMQVAAGENSDSIQIRFKTEQIFLQIEKKLRELMTKEFGFYQTFDTGTQSIEGIVDKIINDITRLN